MIQIILLKLPLRTNNNKLRTALGKLTFYDKIKVSDNIIDNLNEIGENIVININFIKRLRHKIYNWYVFSTGIIERNYKIKKR